MKIKNFKKKKEKDKQREVKTRLYLNEQCKDRVEWLSVSILFPPPVEYFTLPSILNLGMWAMEGNFVS